MRRDLAQAIWEKLKAQDLPCECEGIFCVHLHRWFIDQMERLGRDRWRCDNRGCSNLVKLPRRKYCSDRCMASAKSRKAYARDPQRYREYSKRYYRKKHA